MWPIATYVDQNLVKVAGKRCTRSSPPSPTPTLACCYAAGWALVVTLWLLPKWWGQAIYENRAAPRFLGHRRGGGGSSQMMMMQRAIVPISRWAALPVVLFLSLFFKVSNMDWTLAIQMSFLLFDRFIAQGSWAIIILPARHTDTHTIIQCIKFVLQLSKVAFKRNSGFTWACCILTKMIYNFISHSLI